MMIKRLIDGDIAQSVAEFPALLGLTTVDDLLAQPSGSTSSWRTSCPSFKLANSS
jgi:hypothetical protein